MKATKFIAVAIVALFAMGLVFAVGDVTDAKTRINQTLKSVCDLAAAILPVIAFVLFIMAGFAYAAGNFFGADARAKSVGWAMNMITGAVISFLLWLIGPIILAGLSGGQFTYKVGATACEGSFT